jgi:DNA-directed RNA polymerase II subunit RPB2
MSLTSKLSKKIKNQFKDIEEQTWDTIYSYFKNHPKWTGRHQLDSYNDFIHNNIPRIFKQKGYYRVLSYRGEYSHIFEIYLGGKTHDKFRISHPTIYDHKSGKSRPLYPNEARLKNLTYGFDLFYDVDIVLNVYEGNEEKHIIKDYTFPDADFLKNVYLGNIPIMLHSDVCILNKIPKSTLHLYGENPEEPGGYIILDGAEKVLLCQQRKAENTLFFKKITGIESDKYKHQCVIKSKLDEAFQPARDNCLYIENNGEISMRIGPIGKEFIRPITAPEHPGFRNKYIPIFVLFRYLGIESDKEIIEMICGNLESNLGKRLSLELIPSIQDKVITTYNIYDKQGAELLLAPLERTRTQLSGGRELKDISRNKIQRLAYLKRTFTQTFLPHCGDNNKNKAYYLAYMIRKLLLNYLEIDQSGDTSLDSYINKRIDTGGYLMSTLFRTAFIEGILYNIRRQIDTILELNPDMRGPAAITVINENTYRTVFSVESFNKYFTSKLKIGLFGNKAGVLQQLDRTNYLGAISHIRRMNDPTFGADKSMVAEDKRKVHSTHFGFICPNESNDGGNIGLRVALALMANISIGYPIKQLKQWCFNNGVISLSMLDILNIHDITKIFINGTWIGCHQDPILFVKLFKLYRRNSLINSSTSISFYTIDNEIKIWCDDGRVIRPVYIVENNELLITDKEFNKISNDELLFDELCGSRLLKKNDKWNLLDTNVYNLSRLGLTHDDKNLEDKLINNQCFIEYIDPQESDNLLINIKLPLPDFTELKKRHLKYTHSEIHPVCMLGFMAQVNPACHHSQGTKYVACGGTKHPRQSLGVYHPSFDTRFDTGKIMLAHNPERPIVRNRMTSHINHDKFGTGNNIIVAISVYDKHNQEDGLIMNKSSVDMGLFHTSYYKKYEAFETIDEKTGMAEKFYNPYYRNENNEYPENLDENHGSYTFEHLDKYGFVKPGTYLKGNEVLIGKFLKTTNAFGEEKYDDLSSHVKPDNIESYVDRVYTSVMNAKGLRLCKIRTCQFRKPENGDKFASRHGQKGTTGIMLPKEDMPFTRDGIIPDLIFNPFGVPTRMTLGQMIEHVFTEIGIDLGFLPQANTMEKIDIQSIIKQMEEKGFNYYGDKVLYNGFNGDQMKSLIFMTPVYYQRVYLQTRDKINARCSGQRLNGVPIPGGSYTAKERQVVQGRANGGGIKVGEMERDSLIAHGIMGFINENTMKRGDKFYAYVSPITGEFMIGNPEDKIFFDNSVDGPISYHLKEGTGQGKKHIIGPNTFHKKQNKFVKVQIPYAMKLLIHDCQGMGISLRLKPETRKLILNKEINGSGIDDMILELDDIVKNENEQMQEYLKKSLIEQIESDKEKNKNISNDNSNEILDDVNINLEQQRQQKINSLSSLSQNNNQNNNSQQIKFNPNINEPRVLSPLNVPDIGNFTLSGTPLHTSSGQNVSIINNPRSNFNIPNQNDNLQLQNGDNISHNTQLFKNLDNPFIQNNNYNDNNQNIIDQTNDDINQTGGEKTPITDLLSGGEGLTEMPEINFSQLDFNGGSNEEDDMQLVDKNLEPKSDEQIPQTNQSGGNNGDIKKVSFEASDKELSAMGL